MESDTTKQLIAREIAFCNYVALGYDGSDAYRRAFKAKRLDAEIVAKRANRLLNEPGVRDKIAACVGELKLEQLDSLGKAYKDLLMGIEASFNAKNYNAYFAGMRLRLQCQGLLKDNVNISTEQRMTDEQDGPVGIDRDVIE